MPRVVLVPGLGLFGIGNTSKDAKIAADLAETTVEVVADAERLGTYECIPEPDIFDIEYWSLEQAKLGATAERPLARRIAVVTGGASGIGAATAAAFAKEGAEVVVLDRDVSKVKGFAIACDVTKPAEVRAAFDKVAATYGGVDIVVSNAGVASSAGIEETTLAEWERNHAILGTGYFLVAREAFAVLRRQGRGGSIVFVASKNALVAGRNAAAYSSAKAAELHLARCLAEEGGADNIRVNTVNPDAVLQGSRIWDSSWREERAAAYGIEPDELEEHYRKRTTLGVNIVPEDIAQAVLHFASNVRSGKSTGNVLNVDGGVPAAYPR
jgi:NAD(P)-dependent dehydrogenase (short-subunit alcohol dehydrogenase family)